jgi:hypothetical protein
MAVEHRPGVVTPPHRYGFEPKACKCDHEDWQHDIRGTCSGGKTANSCPCQARWREVRE